MKGTPARYSGGKESSQGHTARELKQRQFIKKQKGTSENGSGLVI